MAAARWMVAEFLLGGRIFTSSGFFSSMDITAGQSSFFARFSILWILGMSMLEGLRDGVGSRTGVDGRTGDVGSTAGIDGVSGPKLHMGISSFRGGSGLVSRGSPH